MSAAAHARLEEPGPLTGAALILTSVLLAVGNFMVVLDMTIANVSVPNIAGSLAVAPSEGTWVITSYSVAEAIIMPLTGWLAARFGAVRVFVFAICGFGACSALCGLAPSLGFLVAFRVMQGLCGGPIMPMSQTLMMRIFPVESRPQAMGLWSMTSVAAPIAGPILGGVLCDNAGWPWVFYINVPVAAACGYFALAALRQFETPTVRRRVDTVGLCLLIAFVGPLEIMLDKGRELDWFDSPIIVTLGAIALVSFVAFVIWELTDKAPIVNLRIFRHRGYVGAVITLAVGYGAFFSNIVVGPLWLQTNMGYTASWAGLATGVSGMVSVLMTPLVPRAMRRVDARALVTCGVLGLSLVAFWRSHFASNITYWGVAITYMAQGLCIPFMFNPTNQIALSSVPAAETATAAGLANFMRTLSAAFTASIVTTFWDNAAQRNHADLAGTLHDPAGAARALGRAGFAAGQSVEQIDRITQGQAVMSATDQTFLVIGLAFAAAAVVIWLAPKPNLAILRPTGPARR